MDFRFSDNSTVREWDGSSRLSPEWDNLKRDPELWLDNGDCLVYLHASGQSQRGPSFLIPSITLVGTILEDTATHVDLEELQPWDFNGSFYNSERYASTRGKMSQEIFIVAPARSSKKAAFDWHITTRNYFAFCCGKALAGISLGQSLLSLYERLQLWRPSNENNSEDVIRYAENLGYLKFSHCPDYALAMLQYAENLEIEDLWVDAFTHCVGMNNMLDISNELQYVSSGSRSLIERSSASLCTHLERVTKSLGLFLAEDLSPSKLGLSPTARTHLDLFRRFLRQFYVRKFGYWPPARLSSKVAFESMHSDFRHLYNYLVDSDSSGSISKQGFASGGICVFQTIQNFDFHQKFDPLPHPLPLMPQVSMSKRPSTQRALSAFKLGQSRSQDAELQNALSTATNTSDDRTINAPIVKDYQKFERESLLDKSEKLTFADARKVRWILVYCTLQLLNSIIKAPGHVRDADNTTYFLCCDVPNLPLRRTLPVKPCSIMNLELIEEGNAPDIPNDIGPAVPVASISPESPAPNIRPDCQTDNYNRHMEVSAPPSWKDRLAMRDPSTMAFNQLARQERPGSKKGKQQRPNEPMSTKRTSSSSSSSGSNYRTLYRNSHSTHSIDHLARHSSTSTGTSSRSAKQSISGIIRKDTSDSTKSRAPSAKPTPPGSRAIISQNEPGIANPIIRDFQFENTTTTKTEADQDEAWRTPYADKDSSPANLSTAMRRITFVSTTAHPGEELKRKEESPHAKGGSETNPRSSLLRSLSRRSWTPLKSINIERRKSMPSTSILQSFSVRETRY